MPLATATRVTRPEELVEHFSDMIEGSLLPFAYIAKYDENLMPEYPAVLIQPGQFEKDLHGTHTYLITLRAIIYVMHAKLTVNRQRRNLEDLQLATDLIAVLEESLTLGGRIIHGWIESELPAALPPRTSKGDAIVGTRLSWVGINETRFK